MLYFICWHICRVIFTLFFRVRIRGQENIPRQGPVILAPNHVSFLDPPTVGIAAGKRKFSLYFMARKDLFDAPFLGWLIKRMRAFPVKRGEADRGALKKALEILKQGKMLLVFPEGTRSVNGELLPGEPGIGMLAWRSEATIIPTVILGSDKAWPRGSKRIHPAKIKVCFGEAIAPRDFPRSATHRETYQALSDRVMEEIKKLKTASE